MRYVSRTENPNAIAGIFLLILLAVFAGPNVLPRLLSDQFPFVYEGVPCDWLRAGDQRAIHQSLLGRAVSNRVNPPISLTIKTSDFPAAIDGPLVVWITVTNNTIGTIPILVTTERVVIGTGTGESGLGIAFNNVPVPVAAQNVGGYPETQIRLLGPRQRCVHRALIQPNQFAPSDLSIVSTGSGSVKAFYRNNTSGTASAVGTGVAIYGDQGLWVGVTESDSVDIPVSVQ